MAIIPKKRDSAEATDLTRLFEAEILKAEVLRTTLLLALGVSGFLVFLVGTLLASDELRALVGQNFPWKQLLLFFGFVALYEAAARTAFLRAARRARRISMAARLANALVETSLPGIAIYIVSHATVRLRDSIRRQHTCTPFSSCYPF